MLATPFKTPLCAAALILSACAFNAVHAEGLEEQIRYDFQRIDGILYRFDRVNGSVDKLDRGVTGMRWVRADVKDTTAKVDANIQPPRRTGAPTVSDGPSTSETASINETRPKKSGNSAPIIIEDDSTPLVENISEDTRRNALAEIASYESKLSMSHTVQIGDRITGTIMIKNLGDKKLRALELTMVVPIVGQEKPEEHRFLFLDKTGKVRPPQPGQSGRDPQALLQKVDIPCPSGGVKGSPELKVSYIRFAE